MQGRFLRLAETERPTVQFVVDGRRAQGLEGDTLLVALMCAGAHLRESEFGDGPRAGFCLMGACQDCWVWTDDGRRLRACTTTLQADHRIVTRQPASRWPHVNGV